MTRTALVLGGGGVTGIAWQLGILQGLAQAGHDLTTADTVIGTSAGAVVGAQVTSERPLDELFGTQLAPPDHEIGARVARVTMARLVPRWSSPAASTASCAGLGGCRCGPIRPEGRKGSR